MKVNPSEWTAEADARINLSKRSHVGLESDRRVCLCVCACEMGMRMMRIRFVAERINLLND